MAEQEKIERREARITNNSGGIRFIPQSDLFTELVIPTGAKDLRVNLSESEGLSLLAFEGITIDGVSGTELMAGARKVLEDDESSIEDRERAKRILGIAPNAGATPSFTTDPSAAANVAAAEGRGAAPGDIHIEHRGGGRYFAMRGEEKVSDAMNKDEAKTYAETNGIVFEEVQ